MFCTKCGSEIEENVKFCSSCGNKIMETEIINPSEKEVEKQAKSNYYFDVLKKYAVFGGRARRKEYWMFYLYNFLICFALGFIEGLTGIDSESDESLLASIYCVAILMPTISVGVRRMHDVNKNGWYIIFPIYNLILLLTDGTKGNNKYGSDPKEIVAN